MILAGDWLNELGDFADVFMDKLAYESTREIDEIRRNKVEIWKTILFPDESVIVGRGRDELDLVEILCEVCEKDLEFTSVEGMEGQGKITIARVVYNSHRRRIFNSSSLDIFLSRQFSSSDKSGDRSIDPLNQEILL